MNQDKSPMTMPRRDILMAAAGGAAFAAPGPAPVPMVPFGPHKISRLIVGGNPVSGNSHVSKELDLEMRDYFTAANIKRLLRDCERAGINTWQSRGDRFILRMLNEYRSEGGGIQWIAQTASELANIPGHIRDLAGEGPIGIYHHGTATDRFWAAGKIERAREMLKVIRETGVQVGLGTHNPEVVDYAESKGWDLDFYMACVYNMNRPRDARGGEVFLDADREKMLARVKQTPKQCLIFKVYGAGRNCGSPAQKKEALDLVFRYAKPHDAVVIGMFPKRTGQAGENGALVAASLSR